MESLKDELEVEKQNENEQVIIMEKVKKYSEKKSQKQKSKHKYNKQVPQAEDGFRIFLIVIGLIIISVIFSELQ